jgi:hypothetical protein
MQRGGRTKDKPIKVPKFLADSLSHGVIAQGLNRLRQPIQEISGIRV